MAQEPTVAAGTSPVHLDEVLLVEQARSGDMAAFSRLVTRYQDRILNTCWRLCGNRDDAQDLTQEAFLRALQSIGSFSGRAAFYTWLYRIAVNLAISHHRRAGRHLRLSLDGRDGEQWVDHQAVALGGHGARAMDDPSQRLTARETERQVVDALDTLDDDHRTVIVLRDIEGLDYEQIAGILEVPPGTVKSRLHRARMTLRERLRPLIAAGANGRGGAEPGRTTVPPPGAGPRP